MKTEFTVKIAGEAGQGIKTIGMTLCKVFKDAGFNIFANLDYMSRIRGGNNFFQVRVACNPVQTLREKADILICLDKQSIEIHEENVAEKGCIIVDREEFKLDSLKEKYRDIPFYKIAHEEGGREIYISSAASGIIAGLAHVDFKYVEYALKDMFSDKPEEIVSRNIQTAQKGYESSKDTFEKKWFDTAKPLDLSSQLHINGNEAIALGAIHAGVKFYSAYPMTPATSILNTVAHYAARFNIVVEQAEDEIGAINMVIGASFAGARSMTATSGGGFALMQEGVSLAAMTETPIVVANVQRPAPATGLPTRTEQSDLSFVLYSGHGEFAKVVFTPGTIEECFYLTVKAFNLADKYQIPVFILSDQHLADSIRNIERFDLEKTVAKKYVISKEESRTVKGYKRYAFTKNGISPRAVPSWINDCIYADSDEHTEEGHITEDGDMRVKMMHKRLYKKLRMLEEEIEPPKAINVADAETVFIGFGSTFGVLKDAIDSAGKKEIGFIHVPQVWPFPAKEITRYLHNKKKVITVENNATGQLARLVRQETGAAVSGSILKYNGRPFSVDELREKILKEA